MGRPLAKRFFGNFNIGTTGTADNGIGGEGLDTIPNPSQLGNILVCSTATSVPVLMIPAPELPDGVPAEAEVTWEVSSVVVTNGLAGNNYTTTTGGATTLTGLGGGATFNITAVGSGQGEVQTIVPADRGSFTTIPVTDDTYQVNGGDGNQQVHVYYRVKSIVVTEKGSGYTAAPDIGWDINGVKGTFPGYTTAVLTTDVGSREPGTNRNVDTNQDNAIIIHANVGGMGGTLVGDIISQKSTRRYKVKTTDGTRVCKLVDNDSPAAGEAYIVATATGGTYYVTKLTAHRAVLVSKTGDGALDGKSVRWTFGSPSANVVQIENA